MIKTVLITLILVLCFAIIIPYNNPASAQTLRPNDGYVELVRALLYNLNSSVDARLDRTPLPTAIPTIYIPLTPTPTIISELENLTPAPAKENVPKPNFSSLNEATSYVLAEVNAYRASRNLAPVVPTQETCDFAATRARESIDAFNHTAFYNRVDAKTIPYAKWTNLTENLAEVPDYKLIVNLWKNSPSHAANMRADTPFVCVQQYKNYFAYEGMKPEI
jgi:uncharacterized protein YkwD